MKSSTPITSLRRQLQTFGLGLFLLAGITTPVLAQNPEFVSRWPGQPVGDALSVTLTGTKAIVAAGEAGVLMTDILGSNPPRREASVDTPGHAYAVAVSDNAAWMYVADGQAGLQIVAITNFTKPVWVSTHDTPGSARSVLLRSGLAYVADGSGGVRILSLAAPANPVLLGSYATTGEAVALAAVPGPEGLRLYVATGTGGLIILNVANPANPTLLGTFNPGADINGIILDGYVAYLSAGEAGLLVVTTTNTAVAAPMVLGSLDTPGYAQGLSRYFNSPVLQLADGQAGIQLISITNQAVPFLLGSYNTLGTARGVAGTPTFAYVADGSAGMQIVRINIPAQPSWSGGIATRRRTLGAAVSGTTVALANDLYGVTTLDVSQPSLPQTLGNFSTAGPAIGVAANGDLVCVAEGGSGVEKLSISNAALPVVLGSYNTPGYAQAVSLTGSLASVADEQAGVHFLDLAPAGNPIRLGGYDTYGWARNSAVAGDLAVVADTFGGLAILSITNPAAPALLARFDQVYANDVVVAGSHAYVAGSGAGLQIVDITNPASPTLAGSLATVGTALVVAVADSYAYVAGGLNGVQVVDVSDPAHPLLVGNYQTPGAISDLTVSGDYLYVSDTDWGLTILRLVVRNQTPPTITQQPGNQFGVVGGTAAFNPTIVGAQPLSYQWYKGTTELAGQTGAVLTLSNLVMGNAGGYHLVVTNPLGAATSQVATLTVLPAGSSLGWFAMEDRTTLGNWKGVYGTQGQLIFGALTNLDAMISPSSYITFAGNTPNPNALEAPGTTAVTNRFFGAQFSTTNFYVDVTLPANQTNRLAVYAVDPGGDRVQRIELIDIPTGTVLDSRLIGNLTNGAYLVWDVTGPIRIRCVRVSGANCLLSGVFAGTATGQAPGVRTQPPASVRVLEGERVVLGAGLNGSPALFYRWTRNGLPLTDGPGRSGSSTTVLNWGNLQPADAGNYVLTTTNAFGSVATLTVAVQVGPEPPPYAQLVIEPAAVEGEVRLTLIGEPNTTYAIKISPDFVTWSTLRTVDSGSGTVVFTDTTDAPQGRRFYRAMRQ